LEGGPGAFGRMSQRPTFLQTNVSLSALTSWQIGGAADFFSQPRSISEIVQLQDWARNQKIPIVILGGGSNVLVSDRGVRGLVVSMRSLVGLEISKTSTGSWSVIGMAGTAKSELLRFCLKEKLAAALFLAGLPGDLGGGVVMNAGVSENFKPREFGELVQWVEILRPTGEIVKVSKVQWGYRHSSLWQPGIILRVGLSFPAIQQDEILVQVRQANTQRLSKQPLDLPSCGSVFRNPGQEKAAQLIDKAGLKGYSRGQAQVSLKHANFVVNLGGATATDTWAVIQHVQEQVELQTGIRLQTEVVRMGEWPGESSKS